ncbi:MAG TPA: hypothetical protein VF406_18610, partial [Thermodesulfobacteriota bacterium]
MRRTWHAGLVGAAVLAGLVAIWLARTSPQDPILLAWDEARYFKHAQDLYYDLVGFDLGQLLRDLRGLTFYPPGHSLVSAAWFALTAPTPWHLTALTVCVFGVAVGLSVLLGARLGSIWAGAAVGLLVAGAPVLQVFAATPMHEAFGVALTLAFTLVYWQPDGSTAEGRRLRAAAALFVMAWWTKYSFGLHLALALLVVHGTPAWAAWRAGDRAAARAAWRPAG